MAMLPKSPVKAASKPTTAKRLTTVPRKASPARRPQREPIAAAKAKTHLLQLLDQVERDRRPIIITKRGRPVAQLVPTGQEVQISPLDAMIGRLKGKMKITGDIVSPDWESWGPEWR